MELLASNHVSHVSFPLSLERPWITVQASKAGENSPSRFYGIHNNIKLPKKNQNNKLLWAFGLVTAPFTRELSNVIYVVSDDRGAPGEQMFLESFGNDGFGPAAESHFSEF